jgi:hypothetical protein
MAIINAIDNVIFICLGHDKIWIMAYHAIAIAMPIIYRHILSAGSCCQRWQSDRTILFNIDCG